MIHSLDIIIKIKSLRNIIMDIVFVVLLAAICSDCTNREVCVAPEECVCSAGWRGAYCTEGT